MFIMSLKDVVNKMESKKLELELVDPDTLQEMDERNLEWVKAWRNQMET